LQRGVLSRRNLLRETFVKSLLLTLLPIMLLAQDPGTRVPLHAVRAVGEATLSVAPDQARISVGVITQAATAEDAVAHDAKKTAAVLDALKSLVQSRGDVRTTNYSLAPQYKYVQGESPTITGYQASHTVEVTLNDVTLVGKVIDGSSKAGANHITRIEFSLKDDQAVRAQALEKATAAAKKNAESIAAALGVSVTGVAFAETSETGAVRPLIAPMAAMERMPMAKMEPTQIESGTLDVHASVTVALEVK
jgi:uncharacterized protein YggE